MNIDELIERLIEAKKKYGNIPVKAMGNDEYIGMFIEQYEDGKVDNILLLAPGN